jgi:anti-sigma B factor antagonist
LWEDEMSSAVEEFAVEFSDDGVGVTVRVVGDVDIDTAGVLAAQLDRAVDGFTGDVTVDMAGVAFLDSLGLCVLLRARSALDAAGRQLLLAAPARAATRIFELTGLQHRFRLASEPG